jgi:hypothetical protein
MVASAAVAPDVSQVATPGADRQPVGTPVRAPGAPLGPAEAPAEPDAEPPAAPARRRLATALGLLIVVVAVVLAALFARASGVPDGEVTTRIAELHGRGATGAPPRPGAALGGVRVPDLARVGWTPVASRVDEVGSRTVATVVAERDGTRLALAVLSGQPLRPPSGGRIVRGDLTLYRQAAAGRTVLSWRRAGRTAVITAVAVDPARLADVATAITPRR